MAQLSATQERELRDAFDLFDTDHSGKISRIELKKVLQALHIKASDTELQQLMTQMDSDHSGEIDFNEFKKVMGASFFKKYSKQELHAAFKKFDTDGNGYITTSELNHILSRMGRHLSRNEIDSMIKSLDGNSDGKISFDEFFSTSNVHNHDHRASTTQAPSPVRDIIINAAAAGLSS